MLIASAILAAALAGDDPRPLEIQSDSDCPSAHAVQAQLLRLMPDAQDGRVDIRREGAQVELSLYSEQQSGPQRRLLPQHPSCEQMAQLAAAVIATWQATVQRAPVRPVFAPPPPQADPPLFFYDLSAAAVGLLSGTQAAIAQQLDLRLRLRTRRFGLRLSALLPAPHTLEIGRAQAAWSRWSLRALPGLTLSRGRFVVELAASAALALLDVAGQGFDRNRRTFGLDVGLGAGLRAGWRRGRLWPFVGIEAAGWLVPQIVRGTYTDATAEAALPRLDLLFSLGVVVEDGRSPRPL